MPWQWRLRYFLALRGALALGNALPRPRNRYRAGHWLAQKCRTPSAGNVQACGFVQPQPESSRYTAGPVLRSIQRCSRCSGALPSISRLPCHEPTAHGCRTILLPVERGREAQTFVLERKTSCRCM
jgi:hypothetical protein